MCVLMVAGVRNVGEPGALERQGGRVGAGVTTGVFCVVMAAVMEMFGRRGAIMCTPAVHFFSNCPCPSSP